jgi:hypothetical protein
MKWLLQTANFDFSRFTSLVGQKWGKRNNPLTASGDLVEELSEGSG